MDFKEFSTTEAKNHFGWVFDEAGKKPVKITKRGGKQTRIILDEEFFLKLIGNYRDEDMSEMVDEYWTAKCKESEARGYLSAQESKAYLEKLRNE